MPYGYQKPVWLLSFSPAKLAQKYESRRFGDAGDEMTAALLRLADVSL